MAARPFLSIGIEELEKAFDAQRDDPAFLKLLIAELQNRRTQRATKLRERAVQALGVAPKKSKPTPAAPIAPTPSGRGEPSPPTPHPPDPVTQTPPQSPPRTSPARPTPKPSIFARATTDITGLSEPERIMLTWTALEVLSPQSFRRPEDLAAGERYRIAYFGDGNLPWENGGEKSRPKYRLYYQVVLGTIDMENSVTQLLSVYTDKRAERPQTKGEGILATILVDREGRPVEDDAVALSSFAWGVPVALNGNLTGLGNWQSAERSLLDALDQRIRRVEGTGKPAPLSRADIEGAHDWLVEQLGVPLELVKRPAFCVRMYQWFKLDDTPDTLLLNSFFLPDLDRARRLFQEGKATPNLKRYVGQTQPASRRDLLRDSEAIKDALNPAKIPMGRWPAAGWYPLVALQQAAVNLAAHHLHDDGILAVNGPPGTGKTTLLRDVVAHVVTERAAVMATYTDPENAFTNSKQRVKKGQAFLWMYELDEKLRGFEIVVASSNNKAVENVSAELPGLAAVANGAFPKGYFKTVSDTLLERDTWGMVAAVLGNASNRFKFSQRFWWNDDFGMSRYLQHAVGTPSFIIEELENGEKIKRPPIVVTKEKPPADKDEALRRWRLARNKFKEAEAAVIRVLDDATTLAALPGQITDTDATIAQLTPEVSAADERLNHLVAIQPTAKAEEQQARSDYHIAKRALEQTLNMKPAFLSRLFNRENFRRWQASYRAAIQTSKKSQNTFQYAEQRHIQITADLRQELSNLERTVARLEDLRGQRDNLARRFGTLESELGGTSIDQRYFQRSHEERQFAAPWIDGAAARKRDDLFEAAMELHRAFIDAAARPLRHNMGLLMDSFGTRSFGTDEKDRLIPHLWSSLFLAVPVVSTTFASVARMFSGLGNQDIGWLLIDEAGQALPQAAVGALMRSQRAVVVGDPLQIEPVVVLPESLTEAICKEFQIDETRYNAPSASAQTLADAATPYFASFETKTGSRDVGVPLLVHRRCADPMFSISNSIAYENLMVQAKANRRSLIAEVLGPSNWINVEGAGQEKWCPNEGDAVLELLRKLKAGGIAPDLYIVTPFVVVQDRLRDLVRSSGILNDWVEDIVRWPYDRIGTVHTVQGREAEAVIFVLGAPMPQQKGARNWAGGRPNLLNVAVSRAQERLYVVGNRRLWREAGVFSELDSAFLTTGETT